jgi:hypothetical protein
MSMAPPTLTNEELLGTMINLKKISNPASGSEQSEFNSAREVLSGVATTDSRRSSLGPPRDKGDFLKQDLKYLNQESSLTTRNE